MFISKVFGQESNSSLLSKDNISSFIMKEFKGAVNNHLKNGSNGISIVTGAISPTSIDISGYGNLSKSNDKPVNGDTLFDIASITKTFTTLLFADMIEKGEVNLNDPVEKYLPSNVTIPGYNGQKITLEQLATHTSGLPDFPLNFVRNQSYSDKQIYDKLADTKLLSRPGAIVNYSDIGMALLGHALSFKAHKSFEQLVDERILKVLGMNSTGITLTNETKFHFAKGHMAGKEIGLEFLPELIQPAGAMYSSAKDLLKYLSANLNFIHTKLNLPMQDTHLLRQVLSSSQSSNQTLPLTTYVGLGWITTTNFISSVTWHTGSIYGYTSFIGFNPEKKTGIVILCSCDDSNVPLKEMIKIGIQYLLTPIAKINNINNGGGAGGNATSGNIGDGGSCFALIIGKACGGSTGSTEPRGGAGGNGGGISSNSGNASDPQAGGINHNNNRTNGGSIITMN
ncbi:MAG: beta-lactamase family protein [Thermoproteota archaeon]|nr:beta-lactamase family protein [Thermoproteota archaeon]